MRMKSTRQFAHGGIVSPESGHTPAVLACLGTGYVIPFSAWNRMKDAAQTPTNPTASG